VVCGEDSSSGLIAESLMSIVDEGILCSSSAVRIDFGTVGHFWISGRNTKT
jgi:hypothetical protein